MVLDLLERGNGHRDVQRCMLSTPQGIMVNVMWRERKGGRMETAYSDAAGR